MRVNFRAFDFLWEYHSRSTSSLVFAVTCFLRKNIAAGIDSTVCRRRDDRRRRCGKWFAAGFNVGFQFAMASRDSQRIVGSGSFSENISGSGCPARNVRNNFEKSRTEL